MIVGLSDRVTKLLETSKRLEDSQEQARDIAQTADEARKLRESIASLISFFELVRSRLPKSEQKRICDLLVSVEADTEHTREELSKSPRQVAALRQLQTRVGQIRVDLEGCWRSYASAKVRPQTDLLRLVQQLPEMRAQAAKVSRLIERLRRFVDGSPTNTSDLEQFDSALSELTAASSELQGLAPDVRSFLDLVLTGRATVADLTDEVLAWCRQGARDKALQITFKS